MHIINFNIRNKIIVFHVPILPNQNLLSGLGLGMSNRIILHHFYNIYMVYPSYISTRMSLKINRCSISMRIMCRLLFTKHHVSDKYKDAENINVWD